MVSRLIEREMMRSALPVRRGVLLLVVGPSGAGKDTLIGGARKRFAEDDDVLFVRRAITRPEDPAGEDHLPMDRHEFEAARRSGQFAVSWEAHGLSYGIPATVDDHLADGGVAVANGSRAALPLFAAHYLNLMIVNVTARPEVLAGRLSARGRESADAILARLARSVAAPVAAPSCDMARIDNSGNVEDAVSVLVGLIEKALARSSISDVL